MLATKRAVHPHTRGEHANAWVGRSRWNGSSPHARGTPLGSMSEVFSLRFIPTRAGNTSQLGGPGLHTTVHPHTRGEHLLGLHRRGWYNGSSPHARGTRVPQRAGKRRLRFIPTRAGNTTVVRASLREQSVHPHTRGEHSEKNLRGQAMAGSSPHARGTPRCLLLPSR